MTSLSPPSSSSSSSSSRGWVAPSRPSTYLSTLDWVKLADESRAMDKLGGDYGLDIQTRASPSATNAMRFLRSLKTSSPEILLQNEKLLVSTSRGDKDEELRGRRLHPQKDVSQAWSTARPPTAPKSNVAFTVPSSNTSSSLSSSRGSIAPFAPYYSSSSPSSSAAQYYSSSDPAISSVSNSPPIPFPPTASSARDGMTSAVPVYRW